MGEGGEGDHAPDIPEMCFKMDCGRPGRTLRFHPKREYGSAGDVAKPLRQKRDQIREMDRGARGRGEIIWEHQGSNFKLFLLTDSNTPAMHSGINIAAVVNADIAVAILHYLRRRAGGARRVAMSHK